MAVNAVSDNSRLREGTKENTV